MKHTPNYLISAGNTDRMGASFDGGGVNFAVFSENASAIEICLFSQDGCTETNRFKLPERTGSIWHGHIEGLAPGMLYGIRAHGVYNPDQGHRFNPNKLLVDPYARELAGTFNDHPALLGYDENSSEGDLSFDTSDSAPFVPKAVITAASSDWNEDRRPCIRRDEMIIYEAHVKGLTRLHPNIAEPIRGTYESLASEAMLEHFDKLGVTTIELLPIHAFLDERFLLKKGLRNYWGYNPIGFFALEPRYFGPQGMSGFREAVSKLHSAGIEIILDVVYNHSAESDHFGPTLSFRGLDNASYYRLIAGQPRYYVNDTGCGNTLNISHPHVLRLVMDSLRFWVEEMHIDGFRFDLAATLGREDQGFDDRGGFFDALRQDPVLSAVKLIAEPWDVGPAGYRLGDFPPEFSEWNDRFRDSIRRFWRGDNHGAQDLASCLLGSANEFDRDGRRAWSSVNFITAHDGFTLADLTTYNDKRNEANGEANRDGHHANYSDNCGVEGPTDDPEIIERRARRRRNMLATLLLSQGTPMLLAGDEIGNSQGGNNNAYCQDNPLGWIDWDRPDCELLEFVSQLTQIRCDHPCLRQTRFLHGAKRVADGQPDVEWRDIEGHPLNWRDPALSSICLLVRMSAEAPAYEDSSDAVFVIFNGDHAPASVTMPELAGDQIWKRVLDTSEPGRTDEECPPGQKQRVGNRSVVVFAIEHRKLK